MSSNSTQSLQTVILKASDQDARIEGSQLQIWAIFTRTALVVKNGTIELNRPSSNQKREEGTMTTAAATSTNQDKTLREQLVKLLTDSEAHANFETAVKDVPADLQGKRPKGAAHSPWEMLEHLRLAQWDILEFSRNSKHVSPPWPEGYWPKSPAPPTPAAWNASIKQFRADLKATQNLVKNPRTNLFAKIPWGTGQTVLREVLLLADHNSHHLAQMIDVRRLLGDWPAK
jgi:hypothetical protein